MAKSPQLEGGYTRISNELLEALAKIHLSPNQWRFLMVVIRKTYGFRKKKDWIPISQIVEATGIHKANVSRAKKELIERGLVISSDNKIGLNKDYDLWKKCSKLVQNPSKKLSVAITPKEKELSESITKVISSDNKKLSVPTDSKEKKKNIKKNNRSTVGISLSKKNDDEKIKNFKKQKKQVIDKMSMPNLDYF